MTEITKGTILPVARYNELMTRKWKEDYEKTMKEINAGRRHITELPQLAFYLFFDKQGNNRKRGYVLQYDGGVICYNTKRECTNEKIKRGL